MGVSNRRVIQALPACNEDSENGDVMVSFIMRQRMPKTWMMITLIRDHILL